jgi:DNA-binding NtrC family response regulator
MKPRLLVVDDEPHLRKFLERLLAADGYQVAVATDGVEALEMCREEEFEVAIVDLMMPRMDGRELLERLRQEHPDIAVIILTGNASVESAVEAMKAGAYDYLSKPFRIEEVRGRVRQACRFKELEAENRRLRAEVRELYHYENLVGSSPPMRKVFELIERLSRGESTVLIGGESGTGKEQVARAVHFSGVRAEHPFIPVDCGAVSPTLIESELFGHMKGAFTGAHGTTTGLLRAAGSGTVFLDEIGELPLGAQAKLLRALQEREVRPVGSTKVFSFGARIIAATNRDLEKAVSDGVFREDLYYRLNVVFIQVPPLRHRVEDIPLLTRHFIEKLSREGGRLEGVSPETMGVLSAYSWPGNIRELQNAIEHAAAVGSSVVIGPRDLPEKVRGGTTGAVAGSSLAAAEGGSLDAYMKQAMIEALKRSGGKRREAARRLGIGEATLYRKLKKYGLRD